MNTPFHRNQLLAGILLIFPLLLHAQLKRYTHIDWEVIPRKGLNNAFVVQMKLTDKRGGQRIVDAEDVNFIWSHFRFKTDYPIMMTKGVGLYRPMTRFNGQDSIRVEATCENPALNSVFFIPVIYCKALEPGITSVLFDRPTDLQWTMIMNNGERYPFDANWADLSALTTVADSRLVLEESGVRVSNGEPCTEIQLRLIEPQSRRLVCDKLLTVSYSNELRLDYSGRNGRRGRNGQKGTRPGESGGNGEPGENGSSGKEVTLYVAPYRNDSLGLNLLHVYAESEQHWRQYYIGSDHPSLIIDVRGGNGGDGGNGGNGADAAYDSERITRRDGGAGGSGGYGGNAGDGGYVKVVVMDGTTLAINQLSANVKGGTAGKAGTAGSGGRNSTGLLEALLTDGRQSKGSNGLPGAEGRSGEFSGMRFVDAASFHQLLREQGWR